MRWLRCGVASAGRSSWPAWPPRCKLGAPVVLALLLAGCATSSAEPTPAPAPQAISQAISQADRVEMEDDGLPAQVAPPPRIRRQPDDPSEPFSPNYGPAPSPQRSAPARMSRLDADTLIALAIAAHEMRRP